LVVPPPPLSAVGDLSIEILRIVRYSSEVTGKLTETIEDFDREVCVHLKRALPFASWRVPVSPKPSSIRLAGDLTGMRIIILSTLNSTPFQRG
jgi:hypothetical protein